MAQPLDPYRTLGLPPGASLDEVHRAYRRLAKANHPDSAGEAALPRFLAIQAAYEMLAAGRTRSTGPRTPGRGAAAPSPASKADATRGRGTRDANGRRQRTGAPPRDTGQGGAATDGPAAGATGSDDQPRRPRGRSRAPNKATLGSTSYDAAEDEPFEPDWSGGTWYGSSSGTYWTINPKEYADPRKHGPEYQRRARRMMDGADVDPADDDPADQDPSFAGDDLGGPASETATGARERAGFDGRWSYPDDDPDGAPARPRRQAAGRPADARRRADAGDGPAAHGPAGDGPAAAGTARADVPADERASLSQITRGILAGRYGISGRIVLALVGWPPIGVAIAWASGELTGCSRFAASCVDPFGVGTWLIQLLVIVALVAAPALAALSAAGTIAALAAAVPAAVVLSAAGGSNQPEASSAALAIVVAVAYVVGVAFAAGRRLGWRRVP